ncbi:MAG: hypothetical protein WDN49_01800 [Acetobacteraceae bacterium]
MIPEFCSQTSENRNGPNGCFSVMTAVCGSGVSIWSMARPAARNFGPYLALIWVSVKATSSDVSGSPSSHFASSRCRV